MAGSSIPTRVELLVLALTARGPRSGDRIARETAELDACVHDALHRLERCGLLRSHRTSRRRIYELTRAGRARLASERREWALLARAVARA
jgi:DNA-binding PadR family transcriptional regulator